MLCCLVHDTATKTNNGSALQGGQPVDNITEILGVAVNNLLKIFKFGKGCQLFDVFAQVAVIGDAKQLFVVLRSFAQGADDIAGGDLDGHNRYFDHLLYGYGRASLADDNIVPVFHFQRVDVPAAVDAAVEYVYLNAKLPGRLPHKLCHFIINGNAQDAGLEAG